MPESSGHTTTQSTQTYLAKLGGNLLDSIVRRFSNPETARRNRILLLLLTAGILTLLLLPSQHLTTARYKPGEIATSDIRATQEYLLEDQELTRQRLRDVEMTAPIVYTASDDVVSLLLQAFKRAAETIQTARSGNSNISTTELRPLLEPVLDVQLAEAELRTLLRLEYDDQLKAGLERLLRTVYQHKIVLDAKVFRSDATRGIEVQNRSGKTIDNATSATTFIEISEARRMLQANRLEGIGSDASRQLLALLAKMLKPNLFFDREATEARKAQLLREVKPVLYKIQKGEMIVRIGERVSQEQSKKLEMIYQASRGGGTIYTTLEIGRAHV